MSPENPKLKPPVSFLVEVVLGVGKSTQAPRKCSRVDLGPYMHLGFVFSRPPFYSILSCENLTSQYKIQPIFFFALIEFTCIFRKE